VHRRDRVFTITLGADIPVDLTAASVMSEIKSTMEAMELPAGYKMEWGGEHEDSADANESLGKQLPLSLLIMVLISVLLFNALRQPLIIWLLVPMSVNGVVIGLLGTGLPFTFTALLGLLSLSGMLIKNGIVLVEEIDLVRADGLPLREAIVKASVSRLRPVMLAAVTTILGMAPLLGDAFFVSMAVTIMGGLAFATILTMVAAPVFYLIFFGRQERAPA
jgi:multidrug efflux pump subunit AcrB